MRGGEDRGQEESERARCVQAGSLRDPAAGGTGAVVGGVAGTEEVRAGEMGSTMGLKGRGKREKGGGNYGVLATRNPKGAFLPAGAMLKRADARQDLTKLPQEPPRKTRYTPELGPDGST
jgi:hypothetical protein